MSKKFVLVIEGGADAVFIKEFICTLFEKSKTKIEDINKFDKGKRIKICSNPEIILFIAGGCTHVKKYRVSLQELQDQEYEILMIQDADDPIKDVANGGVVKRNKYLDSIKKEFDIQFDTFLFPNNKDNGDLEKILLSIANEEKFTPFIDSYKEYSNKVKAFSLEIHALELLEDKYQVFNYCQVYHGIKNSNEIKRSYLTEYWDLHKHTLSPLREFLSKKFGI